jgi:membrane peptidoglycan carboxypeptidase
VDGYTVAGKTGTADDITDIWFVGYTPKMAGAVWMGYDDYTQRVRLQGVNGFGGLWPTMIWNRAMAGMHADLDQVLHVARHKVADGEPSRHASPDLGAAHLQRRPIQRPPIQR